MPFKGMGSTEATKNALHDFQARVKKAKTILIAGAGATGVETAGELASVHGKQKQMILVRLTRLANLSTNHHTIMPLSLYKTSLIF